jgi:hypothetical protein
MMKLRREGPYGKEQTFTSLLKQQGGKTDWDSLEYIILRMKSLVTREDDKTITIDSMIENMTRCKYFFNL